MGLYDSRSRKKSVGALLKVCLVKHGHMVVLEEFEVSTVPEIRVGTDV